MEIPEVVSVRRFKEFNGRQKEELYETLLELAEAIDDIPKKSLRKILDVSLAVLRYKGEQVGRLQARVAAEKSQHSGDSSEDSRDERSQGVHKENDKLKRLLAKLEDDKTELNHKIKGLTDEIFQLQKRLQESLHSAEASDKDSSDPLSELDKQEALLRNISTKNKHIKRLLRDIESLQNQNIEQSKTIIVIEQELHKFKEQHKQLDGELEGVEAQRRTLKDNIDDLNAEITRLEGNITYLEEERDRSEHELKDFIEKLETKAQGWKKAMDEKDVELKKLRRRLAKKGDDSAAIEDITSHTEGGAGEDPEWAEDQAKMMKAIEARDKLIEQLELKIKTMAEEMLKTTKLMDKLAAEKEAERDPNKSKSRACCRSIETALQASQTRCTELGDMLQRSEQDNELKSKQAMQAMTALDAYQRGEDGLMKALRKCASLEAKLAAREQQIRALIMELNSMHEIIYENGLLRKRLNIPDDMVISAKNLTAKQRNKDKMIERLTLKLRASEELRLQLKLERSDLRKELLKLQSSRAIANDPPEEDSNTEALAATADSSSLPSEVGEVQDTVRHKQTTVQLFDRNICSNCKEQFNVNFMDELPGGVTAELHLKYQEVLQENETLRMGMQEILEKLREYDSSSDHITIESDMLYRLLDALQKQSPVSTPHRLQTELQTLREREEALRELLQQTLPNTTAHTEDMASIEQARDEGDVHQTEESFTIDLPHFVDTSTRPTTPNRSVSQLALPVIPDVDVSVRMRELEQQLKELRIYEQNYEELRSQLAASDVEAERHVAALQSRSVELQLDIAKRVSAYDFMRADFDQFLDAGKKKDMKHIEETAAASKELLAQQNVAALLQAELDQYRQANGCSKDEQDLLLRQNATLQCQLARLLSEVLNGDNPITDLCTEYGVIDDNLQLDVIAAEEWEKQRNDTTAALAKRDELQRQIVQLEALLDIAQQQIQSQQRILNEITDNHISLRHLVADLQSSSEDKFLLAKMQRDLEAAKSQLEATVLERDELRQQCQHLEIDLKAEQQIGAQLKQDFQDDTKHKNIKIKFLQKSMWLLREKYAKFTPLIFLTNFVFAHTNFSRRSRQLPIAEHTLNNNTTAQLLAIANGALEEHKQSTLHESQHLLKVIKAEMQCKLLEENVASLQAKYEELQSEHAEQRLQSVQESQHWQMIEALFGDGAHKEGKTTTSVELKDRAVNTENGPPSAIPIPATRKKEASKMKSTKELVDKNTSPITSPIKSSKSQTDMSTQTETTINGTPALDHPREALPDTDIRAVSRRNQPDDQAKNTSEVDVQTCPPGMSDRSVQTAAEVSPMVETQPNPLKDIDGPGVQQLKGEEELLQKTREELSAAQQRIQELEKTIATSQATPSMSADVKTADQHGIIEKTILSFHTLLAEKDRSISQNQDMLQSEREQGHAAALRLSTELENAYSTITNLNFNIRTKDMEILELKTQLEVLRGRNGVASGKLDGDADAGDNSLHELTDEKIEEMFEDNSVPTAVAVGERAEGLSVIVEDNNEKQDTEALKELPTLLKQIKELKDKTIYAEQTLKVKEDELMLLREKLTLYMEREKSLDSEHNPEMEQLRLLLEDKDKHINDLMETLSNFHDDQRRYINDSSNDSADRISKLAGDLTRTEATNKIYQTQVEALRRQLASLTQREKQARELNQSLRNQLIKRPVVSIKTELNARVKNENLQKRIQHLELELEDAKAQIHRQQMIIETKRTRSATEVGLWEKQKRWQQNAEKFKARLEETECALEKTRNLLQAARNTVARLEKDKQVLEAKLSRVLHGGASASTTAKCCRTPSCPNLHNCAASGKYTPSESPETYTGGSSECSSPAHQRHHPPPGHFYAAPNTAIVSPNAELFEALKARLELQQRKIIAMEMEGKGTNALTTEMERLQEKLSAIEAQNIRLESKNLQLQLDNDVLRQGDGAERMQKRIKHLEDYIIALKEEMAQAEARRDLCKCSGIKVHTQQGQSAEQTILSLRNIVEKLRSENKYLKEGGRRTCDVKSEPLGSSTTLSGLQQMYNESLAKINLLQNELRTRKCTACSGRDTAHSAQRHEDELRSIKEQLMKKTQLLQKAKVLLTRAAAKEKVLKEQLALWKRKCSELQNVPVIEEISE